MANPPNGGNDWMNRFNELQKQQVDALILQNQNQKLQLEILSLQLKVENEKGKLKSLNGPEGSKIEIEDTAQPQQGLIPLENTLPPLSDFVMQGFGSDINQSFAQFPNYNPDASQGSNIFPEQNQNFPEIQQQQQDNTTVELPDITNLDSVDGRLMMALCYNMPPPPQVVVASDPFTPTNKRTGDQGNSTYSMTLDNQLSSGSARVRRPEHRHPSIIRTPPVSPMESPRVKRARTGGSGVGLLEYNPNILGGFKGNTEAQRGALSEALQTYAADVEKLAFALTRKDLEECIMELALREEEISMLLDGESASEVMPRGGLVRSALLKKCNKSGRKVVFNKDVYPMSMGLNEGSQFGMFKKLSLEILIHIVTFLPLGTALKFILSVCKSFRALMSAPTLWNNMVIEPKNQELTPDGFIRLIRALPETSIRYLTIDTSNYDSGVLSEIIELLIKGKQFGLTSLHISGKKLSFTLVLNAVKRLWADKITVFSLTDVTQSKIDPEQTIKQVLSLMPNLKKLRMEGGTWDAKALRCLSCLHGQLRNTEMSRLIGDNRLTHISLSGPKTMVSWDDLKNFGKWFPEVEELFIQCAYADETEWIKTYADGPAKDETDETIVVFEGAKYRYRKPNSDEISWIPMQRLKYFGCGNICEQTKKHQVKAFEDIHAAYIWSLLKGSRDTLERLELSRGQESTKQERGKGNNKVHASLPQLMPVSLRDMCCLDFPKLTYLYLGFWDIHWESFTTIKSPNYETISPVAEASRAMSSDGDRVNSPTSVVGLPNVKKFIFWGCTGIPKNQDAVGEKTWIEELKNIWGEDLEAVDESIGLREALKGNKGMGDW